VLKNQHFEHKWLRIDAKANRDANSTHRAKVERKPKATRIEAVSGRLRTAKTVTAKTVYDLTRARKRVDGGTGAGRVDVGLWVRDLRDEAPRHRAFVAPRRNDMTPTPKNWRLVATKKLTQGQQRRILETLEAAVAKEYKQWMQTAKELPTIQQVVRKYMRTKHGAR
jgi:hypothetical protein